MVKISALPPAGSLADDDETPFVDDSTASTKKFTLTILKEWFQSLVGWITTAMIGDGQVTAAKLDSSAIAQGYLEIGRTTLGSAGDTISVTGLPARTYLKVIAFTPDSGGTISHTLFFNNDTAANYSRRRSEAGAAEVTAVSVSTAIAATQVAAKWFTTADIINVLAQEKLVHGFTSHNNGNGAGNIPNRIEFAGKWANTSAQISRIDLVNGGAGDYAAGSVLIVLGKN